MLQTVRQATVAVVQSDSEREHYHESSEDYFRQIASGLPWAEFRFFDGAILDQLSAALEAGELAAVVLASNALRSTSVMSYLRETDTQFLFQREIARGVGLVALHQYLIRDTDTELQILPPPLAATVRSTLDLKIDPASIHADDDFLTRLRVTDPAFAQARWESLSGTSRRRRTIRALYEPKYPEMWQQLLSLAVDGTNLPVMHRSRGTSGWVLLSAFPLDWLDDGTALRAALERATRSLGYLYVYPEGETTLDIATEVQLLKSLPNGAHMSRLAVGSPALVDLQKPPFRHFGHISIASQWTWDNLPNLSYESVLVRLENAGSITVRTDGPGGRKMRVTLAGDPPYLSRLRNLSAWLLKLDTRFGETTMTSLLALQLLAIEARAIMSDAEELPTAFSRERMNSLIRTAIRRRLDRDGTVDQQFSPTVAVYRNVSCEKLLPEREMRRMRRWIMARVPYQTQAALLQAALWVPDLRTLPAVVVAVAATDLDEVTSQGRLSQTALYAQLLTLEHQAARHLPHLLDELEAPDTPSLRRAIIAYYLTCDASDEQLAMVARASGRLGEEVDTLRRRPVAAIETVCLGSAALLRLEKSQVLSTASLSPPGGQERIEALQEAKLMTGGNAKLRDDLQSAALEVEALRASLNRVSRFGRAAASLFSVVILALVGYEMWILGSGMVEDKSVPDYLGQVVVATLALGWVGLLQLLSSMWERLGVGPHWLRLLAVGSRFFRS